MRAGAVWCLFLFALAVEDVTVRASGATRGLPTDDKVAIVLKPSKLLFGSCPKLPAPTMNVRLQALKTKSGAIFRRKTVTDDEFACLAAPGSHPLAASSIQECSKQAEAAGLKMFRWNGGLCTGYTKGIPVSIARCARAGSVLLYSMDVEATKRAVVSNITIAFSANGTVNATWDVTPNSCFVADQMYRVSFNNRSTFVSAKLATVGLETALPCAEYNLSVTPVDANSAAMGPVTTVEVVMPKALELSLNLTHGVSAVKASWRAEYTCNPNTRPTTGGPIESYVGKYNAGNWDTDNSTFEYTIDGAYNRCTDSISTLTASYKEFSIKALDVTGAELGSVNETLKDSNMPGHRYLPDSPNCIYYQKLEETPGRLGFTYEQLLMFCKKTMLSDLCYDEGALIFYTSDLEYLENLTPSIVVAPHYVGLKRNSTSGKWVWLSGLEQIVPDDKWDSGEPSTAGDCVELRANKKLAAVGCNATNKATVCFDFLI